MFVERVRCLTNIEEKEYIISKKEKSGLTNLEFVFVSLNFGLDKKLLNKKKQKVKEDKYVIHCAGGYRSMTAASMMKSKGFKNVVNVYGGFNKIKAAGLPIVEEVTV